MTWSFYKSIQNIAVVRNQKEAKIPSRARYTKTLIFKLNKKNKHFVLHTFSILTVSFYYNILMLLYFTEHIVHVYIPYSVNAVQVDAFEARLKGSEENSQHNI